LTKSARQAVRAAGIGRRWRQVAFVGLAAIYVQTLLPLFIALQLSSFQTAERHSPSHAHNHSLVAQHGITQHPASPAPERQHGHHASHGDCALCLGLQLGGPAPLPMLQPLPIPAASHAVFAAAGAAAGIIAAAPVYYSSRGPPQLG
jgi:hypothetical protein